MFMQRIGSFTGESHMADHMTYRLSDLKEQLAELDEQLAAVMTKRRRLAAAVMALEALSAAPNGRPAEKPRPKPMRAPQGQPMQIADAAAVVLREVGRPLNASLILEAINERNLAGRQLKRTSVVSALDAKVHAGEMFTKPGPGTYALLSANGK